MAVGSNRENNSYLEKMCGVQRKKLLINAVITSDDDPINDLKITEKKVFENSIPTPIFLSFGRLLNAKIGHMMPKFVGPFIYVIRSLKKIPLDHVLIKPIHVDA
ncbi:hypothetical protein RF11_08116 [Thelohanellus kitauei]|uniref:Uncharacterized protein n=1 Tax=Thelohanellus kitauei TaxID=669202 RepID=A0A0C2JAH6_THEKT|nr:hypothetical protein RF11_08116 [Thelohanellus kitauei]